MNSYAFVRDPAVKVCLLRLEKPDFGAYNTTDVRQYKELHQARLQLGQRIPLVAELRSQLLEEKKIKTVPMTLNELLELNAPGNAIYILPTFRDECLFLQHLLGIKAKVYGMLAATECIRDDIPLPSQTPLLGLTLRGAVVCFTGIDIATREEKTRIVLQLGGTVAKELSRSVTHLVASTADPKSAKYAAATAMRLPVLMPDWIDDAWQSAMCYNSVRYTERDHFHPAYVMPIFHSLEISATGYGHERPEIMRLIQLHGGTFNAQMSRSTCTHLLAEKNSGEKFKKATERGLHVVRLDWLRKSVQTGYRLPEEKFAHDHALDKTTFPSLNTSAGASSVASSELVANNTYATPKPTPIRPKALPEKVEPVAKPMPPTPRVVPPQKISSMRRSMSTRSLTEAPAAVPDPIEDVDVAKCKMSDCLEGCHLYLCGYADSALPKYKTLVRKLGATLNCDQLDAQATHILVGGAPLDPKTTEMVENPRLDVPVLFAGWLLDCATQPDKPRRLDIDAHLYMAIESMRAEDAPAADDGFEKPVDARNSVNLSSVQQDHPFGGPIGGAGTQTVPETQPCRHAKSTVFQRQSSIVEVAEIGNIRQSDQSSCRNATATNVADPGYPSTVSSSDSMTNASITGNAWTDVRMLGERTTTTNTLSLGLNRETATQERMDISDPTLSTSIADEQTPKQSTPLAMKGPGRECGSRRSSVASAINATKDSMNLSHSPTDYLTSKFPFKLRLKGLDAEERRIRDMPTPQSTPRTSTESLSVSAVGRLLETAVVNTGRGLEHPAVARGSDNTNQMEMDVDVHNDEGEAVEVASTVTDEESVAAEAEPASPSRKRAHPSTKAEQSPTEWKSPEETPKPKRQRTTPEKLF